MKLKNLFNIFLVLVLVSVGVYFVLGNSFSAPTNNSFINNYTNFTFSFNSSYTNVTYIVVFNISNINSVSGHIIYNLTNSTQANQTIFNLTNLRGFNGGVGFGINYSIFNEEDGNYTFTAFIANSTGGSKYEDIFANITGANGTYVNISVLIDRNPPYSLSLVSPNLSKTFKDNTTIQFGFNVSDAMAGNLTFGNPLNCTLFVDGIVRNTTRAANANATNRLYSNRTYDFPHNLVNGSLSRGGLDAGVGGVNLSAVTWVNVSATDIDQGYHTWNVTCADVNNNRNGSAMFTTGTWAMGIAGTIGGNFTLTDTISPTTSAPTLSASSVTTSTSVTITCTGTDLITADPKEYVSVRGPDIADWEGDIGTSPYAFTGTDTVGTYTVRCRSRDTAGNFGGYGSETTFEVTKTAGSTSTTTTTGPSGGPTVSVSVLTGQTKDLGAIADGTGIINAYQASTVTFSVTTSSGGATASSHSIRFDEVNYIKGTATVTISSDPITLVLNVGDVKNVDVDSDGTNDLEVTLNSMDENGQVNMVVKDISVAPSQEVTGGETQPTTPTPITTGMSWIWWVLIIIVVVVIIALLMPKKKR